MNHEIHAVVKLENVRPYVLRLSFEDGKTATIDFLPVLRGELYGSLRDLDIFNQVRLDPDAKTIVWPTGADFDPATLHDWDRVGDSMIEMVNTWDDSGAASVSGQRTLAD